MQGSRHQAPNGASVLLVPMLDKHGAKFVGAVVAEDKDKIGFQGGESKLIVGAIYNRIAEYIEKTGKFVDPGVVICKISDEIVASAEKIANFSKKYAVVSYGKFTVMTIELPMSEGKKTSVIKLNKHAMRLLDDAWAFGEQESKVVLYGGPRVDVKG